MEAAGLVERDDEQRYRPGMVVYAAAWSYRSGEAFVEQAEAAITRLAQRTGHSFGVSILVGQEVMSIRNRTGTQPLRVVLPAGERWPAIGLATGRALLSRWDDADIAALLSPYPEPPTPLAPANLAALMERLEAIRLRGWEEAVDEVLPGLAAVAVALQDGTTGERLALFAAFSALHVSPAQRRTLAAALMAEAERIGQEFGDPLWPASGSEAKGRA